MARQSAAALKLKDKSRRRPAPAPARPAPIPTPPPLAPLARHLGVADPMFNVMELAAYLGVNHWWVYDHRADLPTLQVGRLLRFRRSDVDRWLETQRWLEKRRGMVPRFSQAMSRR